MAERYIYCDKKYVVLTEMIANYDSIDAIICGIGINLNHSDSDFSDDIKQRATSIRLHSNNKINRYSFLKSSFHQSKTIFTILTKPFTEIRNEYIEASNIWQRQLRFTENDKQFIGEAIDIDNDGFLIVRDENNGVRRLISADIDI